MDLPTLLSARDTAGARYAKAVAEMHDALIDLGGIDEALENRRVPLLTFFHLPQNLGTLAHPTFAPANTAVDWREKSTQGAMKLSRRLNNGGHTNVSR